MAKKRKCKPDISNRCFTRMNAKCVDYEGKLLDCSEYDDDDCINVEEAIEDLTEKVNDLCLGDFEGEGCIEYEPEDSEKGLTIKDIIAAHDKEICVLKEKENEQSGCTGCGGKEVDECGNIIEDCCCEILKHKAFKTTNDSIDWEDWQIISGSQLDYKAPADGTYKVTVEGVFHSDFEAESGGTYIFEGVSINGNPPYSDPFNSMGKFIPAFPTNCVSIYILEGVKKGDNMDIMYKVEYTEDIVRNMVLKVIYERVTCK